MKEYPKYDPREVGDEACYAKYGKRFCDIKARLTKSELENLKYPLNKDSLNLRYCGRTPDYSGISFHKCLLTWMSPNRFLELAIPKAHIRESSLDYLWDSFEHQKDNLDPLYLRVSIDDRTDECEVGLGGHEGRHRAEIAKDLGIKEVPVLIDIAPHYTAIDEDGDVAYDPIQEHEDDIRNKTMKTSLYDSLMNRVAPYWKMPDNCQIKDIKPERQTLYPSMRGEEKIQRMIELHQEKREKYI